MFIRVTTLVVVALLVPYVSPVRRSVFLNQVCQHCDSWCPARPLRGHRGPKGERGIGGLDGPRGWTGRKGDPGLPGYTDMEAIAKLIDKKIREAIPGQPEISKTPFESCRDVREKWAADQKIENGVYNITFYGLGEIEVYCDFTTDGGDWLVFQRRMDGSVDFYRDWHSYTYGFGSKYGEFWLGLEKIYQLTSLRKWEMRIDMISTENERYFVKYRWFRIGPSWENFRLRTLETFAGNTSNSLRIQHFGQYFSTYDMDLDNNADANCAVKWHGAWWYNNCVNLHSNLNGKFNQTHYDGMGWYRRTGAGWMFTKFTEMKIRPQH